MVVDVELEVVVLVVVTVVDGAQPPSPQASQQLGVVPTHAEPPFGALHLSAPFLTEHLVSPFDFVWQQVTKPGLPHVDLAAHCTTAPWQLRFCSVAFACAVAHRTYSP